MAVGDEFGLTEDLYQQLIGQYVTTIAVLSKRIVAKDQKIAVLEAQLSQHIENQHGPKEGDIAYGDAEGNPPV